MTINANIGALSSVGDIRVDRPALARHQLFVSVGTAAAMVVVAVAMFTSHVPAEHNQVAHNVVRMAPVVHTTVREVPSNPMQAIDQSKADRRS